MLFVTLPEPNAAGGSSNGAGGNGKYANEFVWLPPAGEADGGRSCAAQPPGALPATGACVEDEAAWLQQGRRLCITWWPGRGQTLEHPAVQRLLAAAASDPGAPEAAEAPALPGGEAAEGNGDATPRRSAVLLFCRAGGAPYTFCGRLLPAAVSSPPADQLSIRSAGCCITWQLADADALLASATFRRLAGLR